MMKIFISWSGKRSHLYAKALKKWLPQFIQTCDPWISDDIERGTGYFEKIGKILEAYDIGIFCVSPENKDSPWLIFEAGALSKLRKNSRMLSSLWFVSFTIDWPSVSLSTYCF